MRIAEEFDPNFSIDRVAFKASDFIKKARTLDPQSWLVFDEPGVSLSHRTWQSEANRITTWFLQSSRYRRVSALFALPSLNLMDIAARTILTFQAIIFDRGHARIYRVKRNQFGSNPDFYTYKLGSVRVGLPSKKLVDDYEFKRREWHEEFFRDREEPTKATEPELVDLVRKNPSAYIDSEGKVNPKKIVAQHGVSFTTAYKVKTIIEGS